MKFAVNLKALTVFVAIFTLAVSCTDRQPKPAKESKKPGSTPIAGGGGGGGFGPSYNDPTNPSDPAGAVPTTPGLGPNQISVTNSSGQKETLTWDGMDHYSFDPAGHAVQQCTGKPAPLC